MGLSFRQWLRRLLDPVLPGMGPQALRASAGVVLSLLLACGALATARLLWAPYSAQQQQAADALWGTLLCLAVMRAKEGPKLWARLQGQAGQTLLAGNLLFSGYWYLGRFPAFRRWLAPRLAASSFSSLYPMAYLAAGSLFFRSLLPFALAYLLWHKGPGELGARQSQSTAAPLAPLWPLYLLLYLGLLPVLVAASRTAAFRRRYPFYKRALGPHNAGPWSHFVLAQLAYLLIFASGEGFWRGFWLFASERELGLYALPLMVVPYTTAHYGKPLAEIWGAVAAGSTLGWLALKHRSFWLGVALHYAVALTMDLLALSAGGFFWR